MTDRAYLNHRVSFAVGTGRCGTTLLCELLRNEPSVASSHERARLRTNFHMFCKWHGIKVDPEGFLRARQREIESDFESRQHSFESSALLSHSIDELADRFAAKFIWLVRHPAATVASFAARGWFRESQTRSNPNLPPTYEGRDGEKARHFFGRIIPNGDEFTAFEKMTPIGRIAWFWQARNHAISEQLQRLPQSQWKLQRIEDLDFEAYSELAEFIGFTPTLSEATFEQLASAKINTGPEPTSVDAWSEQEKAEFEGQVAAMSETLAYSL